MSIKVENITFTYMQGTPYERHAVKSITLEIKKGEFVALIGHTGSGKSTLVQQINALIKPDKGHIFIDGMETTNKKQAKEIRKLVGMVFQYPEHQLFAENIYEDIAFGPRNLLLTETQVAERVRDAMSFVGLDYEKFKDRSPFQLSGGQMRRVAIAGVIAMQPDYLILDEPSAGLDPRAKNAIFGELYKLYQERGMAVILVTHNMEEAAKYAQRILVMSNGEIVCDGTPEEIFINRLRDLDIAGVDIPDVVKLANKLKDKGLVENEYTPSCRDLAIEIYKNRLGVNL